jgi:hypothetical protein
VRNWLRVIALVEAVGGACGFGFVVWALLSVSVDARTALVALFVLGVNALSFVAGVALWGRSRAGRTLSIIVQAVQLPKIVTQQMVFLFSFGLDAWVYTAQAGPKAIMGFQFTLLPSSQLFFNAVGNPVNLAGVSVSSIAFLAVLIVYRREDSAVGRDEPPPPTPHADWQQSAPEPPADRLP